METRPPFKLPKCLAAAEANSSEYSDQHVHTRPETPDGRLTLNTFAEPDD